jgi:hypothetical protein
MGGFDILFTGNSDNNVIYRWKALKADGSRDTAASLPDEEKIIIKTFYLRVPIIEYSREAELKHVKELVINSYVFQFKKWACIQQTGVLGKKFTIQCNQYLYKNNPPLGICCFSNEQIKRPIKK